MSCEYWIQFRDGFHPSGCRVAGDPSFLYVFGYLAMDMTPPDLGQVKLFVFVELD